MITIHRYGERFSGNAAYTDEFKEIRIAWLHDRQAPAKEIKFTEWLTDNGVKHTMASPGFVHTIMFETEKEYLAFRLKYL